MWIDLMVNPKKDSGIMEFKFVTFYLQRKGYLSKKNSFKKTSSDKVKNYHLLILSLRYFLASNNRGRPGRL